MRAKRAIKSAFNLPVILSFNELAWIMVFVVSLLFITARRVHQKTVDERGGETNIIRDLTGIVAKLRSDLETAGVSNNWFRLNAAEAERANRLLANANAALVAQIKSLTNEVHALKSDIDSLTKSNDALQVSLSMISTDLKREAKRSGDLARQEIDQLRKDLVDAQAAVDKLNLARQEIDQLKASMEDMVRSRRSLPGELLGFPPCTNVVFVLDISASMLDDNRWDSTRRTIKKWLELLPIEKCAVIAYSSKVTVLPPLGENAEQLLDLRHAGSSVRAKLVEEIDQLKPTGNTDTKAALARALAFKEVDSIVLFTDGAPFTTGKETTGRGQSSAPRDSKAEIREVFSFLESYKTSHPQGLPRINTVGVGPYYRDPIFTKFLLDLADTANGTFIGR